MSKLNCGVIGVGYLGRFHAQKYANLPMVNLLGVYDTNLQQALSVAQELGVEAFSSLELMLSKVDAVSIAASTPVHYQLAKLCLAKGIHVLLEKPMTETLEEAQKLIDLAKANQCILQIGHLERFNAAYQGFMPFFSRPLWIQMNRLAPFKKRGSEVNVILDLMIHDLDLLLSLVDSPIVDIQASGLSLLTQDIDTATVAISFANRCIANLHASRVHHELERQSRIYQDEYYYVLNFQNQSLARFHHVEEKLVQENISIDRVDALNAQITAFVSSILASEPVLVDGQAGFNALKLALKIQDLIMISQKEKEFV